MHGFNTEVSGGLCIHLFNNQKIVCTYTEQFL